MDNVHTQKNVISEVSKKVILILGLTFLLILPLSKVEDQVQNRREFEQYAQSEVTKGWGAPVVFSSPYAFADELTHEPSSGSTFISIDAQEKKRGVFKVPVYTTTLKTRVVFKRDGKETETTMSKSASNQDYISLPVTPLSSVQSFKVVDTKSGKEIKSTLRERGVNVYLTDLPNKEIFEQEIEFEVILRGTSEVSYQTYADRDYVQFKGNWRKPKFKEEILPTVSSLTSDGFQADWTLNARPNYKTGSRPMKIVGVNLLWIGSDYAKIERAVKYGVLFIALTFLLIFVVEIVGKTRIHPLQYGLIGLSISIFYLLLLAISETVGFDWAYIVSSLAVTGLITFYVQGFMNKKKFAKMIVGEQIALNLFFYVLLTLEESAFLVGSIGLFIALALFMTVTRRLDWYSGSLKGQNEAPA